MDPVTTAIAQTTGFSPFIVLWTLAAIAVVARTAARSIPDTATGWLGFLRNLLAVIGADIKNNTGLPPIRTTKDTMIQQEVKPDGVETVTPTQAGIRFPVKKD